MTDSAEPDAAMGDADLDVEEFEKLFMKLKVMKDKAETLPESDRRQYAEQVSPFGIYIQSNRRITFLHTTKFFI